MIPYKEMFKFFIWGNVYMLGIKVSVDTQLWLWKKIDYVFK